MNNTQYNEWLDVNYLNAEYPTEEEMEMLEEYYKHDIEKEDEKLPF